MSKDNSPQKIGFFLYDTFCEVTIYDKGDFKNILDNVKCIAESVQDMLNIYDGDSELSKLNKNYIAGKPYKISDELYNYLTIINKMSVLSDGKFDSTIAPVVKLWDFTSDNPRIPSDKEIEVELKKVGYQFLEYDISQKSVKFLKPHMQIDAGGSGKGYAVDKVIKYLKTQRIKSATVNFGGNLYVHGKLKVDEEHERSWKVGIQDPWNKRGISFGNVSITDSGLATSAAYDRYFAIDNEIYHHLINPITGYPVQNDTLSVTIITPSAFVCDILSTTFFIVEDKDIEKIAKQIRQYIPLDFVIVKKEEKIIISESLKEKFALNEDSIYSLEVIKC